MLPSTLEAVFISSQRHTEHPTVYSWCYYRASLMQAALLSDRRTTVQLTVSISLSFRFITHNFFTKYKLYACGTNSGIGQKLFFFQQTAVALRRFSGPQHLPTVSQAGLTIQLYCSHYHQYRQRKSAPSCSTPNGAIHVALQGINSTYRQDNDPRHHPLRVGQSKPAFMGTEKQAVSDKVLIFCSPNLQDNPMPRRSLLQYDGPFCHDEFCYAQASLNS